MNDLTNYLETLQFEGYYNYESKIRSFSDNENYQFEIMAFLFVTKNNIEDGYDYGIGSYFKPYYEFADKVYPSLNDISCETLKYWKMRCDESENPYLIARYADLVWTFSELHKGWGSTGTVLVTHFGKFFKYFITFVFNVSVINRKIIIYYRLFTKTCS